MIYTISFRTIWADFDANKHMRHTAYNDYAAECRIRFFNEYGMSAQKMENHNIGPILFKEETTFYREIKMGEQIKVDLVLMAASKNAERFKMLHRVYKENGVIAAEIKVFIAWIDLVKRKLVSPPKLAITMLNQLDKTVEFEEIFIKKSN